MQNFNGMGRVRIKNKPLERDLNSKAVLNTDIDALKEYRDKTKLAETVNTVKEEINTLKNDVASIKELLTKLISRLDN